MSTDPFETLTWSGRALYRLGQFETFDLDEMHRHLARIGTPAPAPAGGGPTAVEVDPVEVDPDDLEQLAEDTTDTTDIAQEGRP